MPISDPRAAQGRQTPIASGSYAAALRGARRVIVFVLGISVVLVGIIMIVTPGPAVVVIPLGLAILATEFLWARRILDRMKANAVAAASQLPLPMWMRLFLPKPPRSSDQGLNVPGAGGEARGRKTFPSPPTPLPGGEGGNAA